MTVRRDSREEERTPFLNHSNEPSTPTHVVPQTHSPRAIVILLASIVFVIMFGDWLLQVPCTRIFEDIICHHYYDDLEDQRHVSLTEKIDEKECKLDPIQSELAVIMAGINVSRALPGILFAFPYGLMADRYGRKFVFVLAITGIILTQIWMAIVSWFWQIFPLRMIWLSPIFMLIGGGETVGQSILFAMISDVSNDATRANNFFQAIIGSLIAELTAPTIASKLMQKDPWIPVFLGLTIICVGSLCMVFVPETLHLRPHAGTVEPITPDSTSEQVETEVEPQKTDFLTALKSQIRTQLHNLYASTEIFHNFQLLLLILTFTLQPLNRQSTDLALRYVSKRFDWTLAKTGFLLSLRALVNILLFAVILPGLAYLLTAKRHPGFESTTSSTSSSKFKFKFPLRIPGLGLTNRTKDLTLARLSMLSLFVGSLLIGFPSLPLVITGLMINVLGTGFATLTRSLITMLVDQQHVARVYAAIAAFEQLGAIVAGPFLALLYNTGLKWRGWWVGLPFFGLAFLDVVAGGGIWAVRLPKEGVDRAEMEVEAREEAIDEVEQPLLGTVH